jgi:hypothetical protein
LKRKKNCLFVFRFDRTVVKNVGRVEKPLIRHIEQEEEKIGNGSRGKRQLNEFNLIE